MCDGADNDCYAGIDNGDYICDAGYECVEGNCVTENYNCTTNSDCDDENEVCYQGVCHYAADCDGDGAYG